MKITTIGILITTLALLGGCMTTGYSYAKDSSYHYAWPGTVTSIESQNIYNSTGVAWVGPLAKVEAKGLKVSVVLKNGGHQTIVQPTDPSYTLHAGEQIMFIEDVGRVWVQPATLPLPAGVQPAPAK